MRPLRLVVCLLALLAGASLVEPAPARACATCQVGDPTLTTFGLGQPFSRRLRLGLRYDMRTTEIGDGGPSGFVRRRHDLGALAAYTPLAWLTLDADVPLARTQVTRANGSVIATTHVGDAAAGARAQVWSRARRGRTQRLWLTGRVTFPTAPRLTTAEGPLRPLRPLEEQAGTGAFVPSAGLGYACLGGPVGGFVTARTDLPTQGFAQSRPGRGLFATFAVQWQPLTQLGVRASWEQAYEATSLELDGSEDPDSGGILWSAALALLWAPVSDVVLLVGGQLPFWQHLRGAHRERPVVTANVIFDLGGDP